MKNRMVKMFVALSICVALAGALAGCAPSQQTNSASSSFSSTSNSQSSASNQASTSSINTDAFQDLNIASMKGPTSIGLAHLMQQDLGSYTVCASADEVTPLLLQDEVQIACVPANLASVLYNKMNGAIRVLDVNTLGVLSVVTGDLSIDSIEALAGHTIYMTGQGTVPEYTVKAVLETAGVSLEDVTLEFKSQPSEIAAILNNDSDAIGILPQPFATAAMMKTRNAKQTIDLTEAWETLTGAQAGSLITGVTIAKADFVEANAEAVDAFLTAAAESTAFANENPTEVASTLVELGIIEDEQLAEIAIPNCNVVCYTGAQMKDALSGYLSTLCEQDPASIGGGLPNNDFYYLGAGN